MIVIVLFNFLGAVKFKFAAVFVTNGAIPDWVNLCLNDSISVLAK